MGAVRYQETQCALDFYVTYQEQIDRSGIRDMIGGHSCFEFYSEKRNPPLDDLLAGVHAC
jgi:hypothetical protein